MKKQRLFSQLFFFVVALVLTLRHLLGLTKAHIESYCPGGGLESIVFYLKNDAFICATSGVNLVMFLTILLGTLMLGRFFCSWVCPIGSLVEFLWRQGRRGGMALDTFWRGLGQYLGYLRYLVLVLVLYATNQVVDLAFRPYCPLYVVMSGQDHEIEWWSKWLMLAIAAVSLLIPFFWCRVLCPLGAVLGLARKISPLAPTIREQDCISCGACDRACPQQISVLTEKRVSAVDCTQCLRCLDACPKDCIDLQFGYRRQASTGNEGTTTIWRLPARVSWLCVVLLMALGLTLSWAYPLPTFKKAFPRAVEMKNLKKTELIVQDLRCRGRSSTLAWILEPHPGLAQLETFVSEFRAVLLYDPAYTSPAKIKEAIEKGRTYTPENSTQKRVRKFLVEKIL